MKTFFLSLACVLMLASSQVQACPVVAVQRLAVCPQVTYAAEACPAVEQSFAAPAYGVPAFSGYGVQSFGTSVYSPGVFGANFYGSRAFVGRRFFGDRDRFRGRIDRDFRGRAVIGRGAFAREVGRNFLRSRVAVNRGLVGRVALGARFAGRVGAIGRHAVARGLAGRGAGRGVAVGRRR